jgi:hypothetical protein
MQGKSDMERHAIQNADEVPDVDDVAEMKRVPMAGGSRVTSMAVERPIPVHEEVTRNEMVLHVSTVQCMITQMISAWSMAACQRVAQRLSSHTLGLSHRATSRRTPRDLQA